ncbi:mannose-1-phosphate guanylyltransferase/mannose-6-phosphate isomerase [Brucella sp. IR073]|uniref:mannose-1-phosphate guanylyltransferase/mannose-6-phosphate isomerase n=1 Tax=unclassified Brucella TaxID=2632610 RepID=UPI003B987BA3
MFIPVIICGSEAEARLWPLSREVHPKPYIELPNGGTLIGRTYARAARLDGVARILTVTNREFLFRAVDAYAEAKERAARENTFLLKPLERGTAGAVALAALHAAQTAGPEAILLVLPADHLLHDEAVFAQSVARARDLAQDGHIVTLGVAPDRPDMDFDYLETDGEKVIRIVKKPDQETTAAYMASGRHCWNSGMLLFKAGNMLEAMSRHCPQILDAARAALQAAQAGMHGGHGTLEIAREPFAAMPAVSIEHAVTEKAGNMACVTLSCRWSDIGSLIAVSELVDADGEGNRAIGDVVLDGARNCFVHSKDRLAGLVGVEDLLVIDTQDALLVAHKDKAQDVQIIYNRLKAAGHDAAQLHRTVHRPWGTYTVLEEGERFKIKRIVVKPGGRLSLQAHHHRSEHWVVVSGTARVVNGETELLLATNQSTYIPCGHRHRLENPGVLPLVLIEVQSGDYLGEDDIVRWEDIYGRV